MCVEDFRGNFTSLRRTFLYEFSHVLLYCFFQVGTLHRAPVCQPRGLRAEGFQPGSATPSHGGSFPTWLTPRRWAQCSVRLVTAVEQAGTSRLQVSAPHDFCRKRPVWNHSALLPVAARRQNRANLVRKWWPNIRKGQQRQRDDYKWRGEGNQVDRRPCARWRCCRGVRRYWLQTISISWNSPLIYALNEKSWSNLQERLLSLGAFATIKIWAQMLPGKNDCWEWPHSTNTRGTNAGRCSLFININI